MPKFKDKVIRKYDGGFNQPGAKGADPYSKQEEVPQFIKDFFTPGGDSGQASRPLGIGAEYDPQAAVRLLQQNQMDKSKNTAQNNPPSVIAKPVPAISAKGGQKGPPAKTSKRKPEPGLEMYDNMNVASERKPEPGLEMYDGMNVAPDKAMLDYKPTPINYQLGSPTTNTQGTKSSAAPDMAKAAGALPKTKSGMKKFMDEYGKFIALGALAGTGGKGGAIAAPIMAALPGILKMLQNRGKKTADAPAAPVSNPSVQVGMAHGGSMGNKSAAHPKKKMAGGAIRKFSGGVMKKVTKKFAEGGEGKSDERESAFRRLDPVRGNRGERAKGLLAPLRKDSISEKLLKEDPKFKAGFLDEQMNDRDMKYSLASIVDEMYNSKNRMPTKGGAADDMSVKTMKEFYNDDSYESPMVDGRYDKKYRGTGGVPYDSPQFKVRQQRHINLGVGSPVDKTPKKMVGGTVRKFKGGSMNTMKENLMPKYKKGGDMPKGMPKEMMAMMGKKGKATGDMPEHKKMDMGMPIGKMPDSKKMGMAKPKPSSMDQKFAKGGTAKYASGGMCKGYGIAKKIRPTGSMN